MPTRGEAVIEVTKGKSRGKIYIACEQIDMIWSMDEVIFFDRLVREGKTLEEIAEILGRKLDEVKILQIDRNRTRTGPRKEGAKKK